MNDLTTLTDAFTELERRADLATEYPLAVPHPRRSPLVAATAASVAVVAVAAGAVVLTSGGNDRSAAGGSPAPRSNPSSIAKTGTPPPPEVYVPANPAELSKLFTYVLDGAATFRVTSTGNGAVITHPGSSRVTRSGASIVGVLTKNGVRGGFQVSVWQGTAGTPAACNDADAADCTVQTLPDGSSLARDTAELAGASGSETRHAELVRANGATIDINVSNRRDPKGAGAKLAPSPPLTKAQLRALVTSQRWLV